MSKRPNLACDQRGIAAIEFAIIAPVMMMMLMGVMEYGYVAFARSSLEHATLSAARSAVASHCEETRESNMIAQIDRGMSSVIAYDDEPTEIEYRAYSEKFGDVGNPEPFDDANSDGVYTEGETYQDVNGNGQWDADMGKSGSVGEAGQVVSYRARFKVRSLFPPIARQFNDDRPFYQLDASTVVRNEPVFLDDCSSG